MLYPDSQIQRNMFQILIHMNMYLVGWSTYCMYEITRTQFLLHFIIKGKSFIGNSIFVQRRSSHIENQVGNSIIDPFKRIVCFCAWFLSLNYCLVSMKYQLNCVESKNKWTCVVNDFWAWRICKSNVAITRTIKTCSMTTIATTFKWVNKLLSYIHLPFGEPSLISISYGVPILFPNTKM